MPATLLIWARAFHFASGMILVGVMAFRWLVLLPAFAGEPDEAWLAFAPLLRRLNALFVGSALVLVLSAFVLFWTVAAGMSDLSLGDSLSPDTLGTVLFQTQFGIVFQWRAGLALVLAVLIGLLVWKQCAMQRKISRIEITAGLFAIALTVSVALTGHAAATGGMEFWFRVSADAIHLFITAIWPTGLLPFAFFLAFAHRAGDAVQQPTIRVIHRFSNVSLGAVLVLAVSGISLACFMLGSFQALFATDYGRLLSLKIFLFLIMLGIASWNRYRLVPRLGSETRDENSTGTHLRRLQGFVLVELTLAVAIVIVVSLLGATPPSQ